MDAPKLKVLFLCTGNSARSILGEYLLRQAGGDRFETVSAGADPAGRVNPLALRVLREDYGIDASGARSQPWTDYAAAGVDLVITVCDHARDSCPLFPRRGTNGEQPRRGTNGEQPRRGTNGEQPRGGTNGEHPGNALSVHWGSPDPAAFVGPEEEALEVFRSVAREIEHRVRLLCALPWGELGRGELEARLSEIGRLRPDGA